MPIPNIVLIYFLYKKKGNCAIMLFDMKIFFTINRYTIILKWNNSYYVMRLIICVIDDEEKIYIWRYT